MIDPIIAVPLYIVLYIAGWVSSRLYYTRSVRYNQEEEPTTMDSDIGGLV